MFLARSQSGKTSLLIKLLLGKWVNLFKKFYIFCPTYSVDPKWKPVDFLVKKGIVVIHTVVSETVLSRIYSKCTKDKANGDSKHTMIIFDDCIGQVGFKTNSDQGIVNKLCCKGNHSNISTVWSIQRLTLCSTIMRTQVEGVIVFYCQENELKMLHQEYGTGKLNWFRKLVELSTSQPYSSLFINRQGPGRPRYFCNFKQIDLESVK